MIDRSGHRGDRTAGRRIEQVPIERLRFGLSPRAEHFDPNHVAALAEVLSDVPPVLVHRSTLRVIDGVHRVLAAQVAGNTTVPAVLFEGDETAAQIEAVRSNVAHGKPLSLAEREASAVRILALVPEWSDRRIAGVSGLSPKTVARLRLRASVDAPRSRVRVGRDGRARPLDPSEVRDRVAEALRSDPSASNRAVARHTGASQATVRDVRDRLRRGLSVYSEARKRRTERKQARMAGEQPENTNLQTVLSGDFMMWFEQRCIEEDQWRPFVERIPISRVYELADVCRRRSQSWRAFASALEDRARGHRRSV